MNAHPASSTRRIPAWIPALPARLPGRLAGWPRRVLAGCLLLAAVVTELVGRSHSLGPAPPTPDTVTVLAAARDLSAGSVLNPADVHPLRLPATAAPAHALTPGTVVTGRQVAGPVRRGEPLTDVRLVGAGLTAGLAGSGSVAVPVRLADPAVTELLHPGDRVDVLAATGSERADLPSGPDARPTPIAPDAGGSGGASGSAPGSTGAATVIASAVMVLAVSPADPGVDEGGLVVVAASMPVARRLAGISPEDRLTIALRPP